jgi:hypothetical protein
MGKRRKRKLERRQQSRNSNLLDFGIPPPEATYADEDISSVESDEELMMLFTGRRPATAKTCGSCREFVEDGEFGRGTCLHPGSGVFSPWDTTAACDFYNGRRR